MLGDIRRFRREILGGFNRRDVVSYIKELSGERDRHRETAERLEAELRTLSADADSLRAEIMACGERDAKLREELRAARQRAREAGNSAFDGALRRISEIKHMYSGMRSDIAETAERVRAELGRAGDSAALMSTVFDKLGKHFDDLRAAVSEEQERLNERTDALIEDAGGGERDCEDASENG
ncbi:MAG: hypothetical protein LBD92_08680 [Oscillospiraceae bacterium]|jgi:chromosome segregation ATPase|nr:hypothetical protein [Oscillospiraceae bacterium]